MLKIVLMANTAGVEVGVKFVLDFTTKFKICPCGRHGKSLMVIPLNVTWKLGGILGKENQGQQA
jgi:hypothetical protein